MSDLSDKNKQPPSEDHADPTPTPVPAHTPIEKAEDSGFIHTPSFQATGREISCEQALRQIERFIEDNDLKEIERALLAAHIKTCAQCHTHLEQTQRIEARLKNTFSGVETHPDFPLKLQAVLEQTSILPAPSTPLLPTSQTALPSAQTTLMSKTRNSETTLTHAKLDGPIFKVSNPAHDRTHDAHSDNPTRLHVSEFSSQKIETYMEQRPRKFWAFRLPLTALILVALGLGLIYGPLWRTPSSNDPRLSPPLVLLAEGESGTVRDENGTVQALVVGKSFVLTPTQTIRAGNTPLKIGLQSDQGIAIGQTVLAAGTALRAANAHQLTVLNGKAHFHIRKDRPKSSPAENFEVRIGDQARVRVTGTAFVIDMSASEGTLVIVEEGKVEVSQSEKTEKGEKEETPLLVEGGHELVLGPRRQVHRSDLTSRLAWLTPPSSFLAGPGNVLTSTPESLTPILPSNPKQPVVAAQPKVTFDWEVKVEPMALYGKSLPEGIEGLSEKLNRPTALTELKEQARKFTLTTTFSFSTQTSMPLKSILAWMSRDLGLRFEINAEGNGNFRTVNDRQPIGPASDGTLSTETATALKTEISCEALAGADTLPTFIRALGNVCGITLICARDLGPLYNPALNAPSPTPRPAEVLLKDMLRRTKANIVEYDHVLYLAPANQIEVLTTVERRSGSLQNLLGKPVLPLNPNPNQQQWMRNLKTILTQTCYPAPQLGGGPLTDEILTGKPIFDQLRLETPELSEPYFVFHTGLCGQQVFETLLQTLASQMPLVIGANNLLSHPAASGSITDLETLITQAREFILIESKVKSPPFSRLAFVNKNLSLGEALEWGTWLIGRGLRQENNTLLIDDFDLCYGTKQMQVLSIKTLSTRYPQLSTTLSLRLTQLLPKLYPLFFPDSLQLYGLQNAIVFTGNRRQLRIAQTLLSQLEFALDNPRPNLPFDLQTWIPPWRIDMEKKLNEPFINHGLEKLSGSFASLLRQSILSHQIHNTLLIDPTFMKNHWNDDIQEIDLSNLTVFQAIERIAKHVGLKTSLEGNVIWLKP